AQLGSTTNDPLGFTVQATQEGPALFISVDPTMVTPALSVGDVISFTVTMKSTVGGQPRATAISDVTRTATATDVTALGKDASALTDLVTALDNYDSELVTVTGTVANAFGTSGSMWSAAQITTAGITTADPTFLLRIPTTLVTSKLIGAGCTFTVHNTPLNRFTPTGGNPEAEVSAQYDADITVTTCPAPTLTMAVAQDATTVKLTFSRPIDATTADMAEFTIVDAGSVALAVTAASVSTDGLTVTLTTDAQTSAAVYTVTVADTVKDTFGTVIGTPKTAMFTGFTPAAAVDHLVINEVDYDQTSVDANSFIEIYNPTANPIALANYKVYLINGGSTGGPTGAVYAPTTGVALSDAGAMLPAGGYLLIRNSTVTANGALTIDIAGDFLQNGADGIALVDTSAGTLIDAIDYASAAAAGFGTGITMATVPGITATVSLVEGTAFTTADSQTGSIGRFPNGADTNNAVTDWSLHATPTPGLTN
ncbi:MAG TPA: lamin tail domain-containing protein, partial [Kofleriaceae bacterium]